MKKLIETKTLQKETQSLIKRIEEKWILDTLFLMESKISLRYYPIIIDSFPSIKLASLSCYIN